MKKQLLMRSEIMDKVMISIVIVLSVAITANAEIFTVELPELNGPLVEKWTTKTASFDFGVSFLQINEVRLQLTGTLTPGSAHGDGIKHPEDEWIDVPGLFEGQMDAEEGFWGMAGSSYGSPLYIDEPFKPLLGATWDFLLDGTDEVTLLFWWGSPIPEWPWIIVTDPTANISEAYLIVDGILVPEPITLFFIGIGGLILRG
jgi:hypothetical protein